MKDPTDLVISNGLFNCELVTKSSPSDQKRREVPIWHNCYAAKMNAGKEINVIEGSPMEKCIELQMGRQLITDSAFTTVDIFEGSPHKRPRPHRKIVNPAFEWFHIWV